MFQKSCGQVLSAVIGMMALMMSSRSATTKVSAFVVPRIRPKAAAAAAAFGSHSNTHWTPKQLQSSRPGIIPAFPTTRLFSTTTSSAASSILKRVKTIDAVEPTEESVIVKGWVRTIRKQKTLAFVQVNDGSNLKGIQCVLSFDEIDEDTKKGKSHVFVEESKNLLYSLKKCESLLS